MRRYRNSLLMQSVTYGITLTYRIVQVGRDGTRTAEYRVVIQSGRGLTETLQKLLQQETHEWRHKPGQMSLFGTRDNNR